MRALNHAVARSHPSPWILGTLLACAFGMPRAEGGATLFSLDPEAVPYLVLEGRAAPSEAAARIMNLTGHFTSGRAVHAWASEGMTFVPGFRAEDVMLSFHVGPRPGALAKEGPQAAEAIPALVASAEVAAGTLVLRYGLPKGGDVSVRVMSLSGRTVLARGLGRKGSGRHIESLNVGSLRAGLYVVRLTHGRSSVISRMVRIGG